MSVCASKLGSQPVWENMVISLLDGPNVGTMSHAVYTYIYGDTIACELNIYFQHPVCMEQPSDNMNHVFISVCAWQFYRLFATGTPDMYWTKYN